MAHVSPKLEKKILDLLLLGLKPKQIAHDVDVSFQAVTYVKKAFPLFFPRKLPTYREND